MRAKKMFAIVKETLDRLEENAAKCLEEKNGEHAQMYLNYANGVRMVIDNIKAEMD